jgi:hypothetical protein
MGSKSSVYCEEGEKENVRAPADTFETSISYEHLEAVKNVWDAIMANKTRAFLTMGDQCTHDNCAVWFCDLLYKKMSQHDCKRGVPDPTSGPQLVKLITICLDEMWRMATSSQTTSRAKTDTPIIVRQFERHRSDSFISFSDIFLNTLTEVYGESMSSAAVEGWKKLYVVVLRDMVIECRQQRAIYKKCSRLITSPYNSVDWEDSELE